MQRKKFLGSLMATGLIPILPNQTKAASKDRGTKGILVKNGEDRYNGEMHFGGGQPNNLLVSSKDTDGDLCIFDATAQMKIGPPLHIHHQQDEIFYVVEGEYKIQVGDEVFDVKKGDSVFAPRKIPHCFASSTDAPSRLLCVFQPAGKMENFFQELGKLHGMPDKDTMQKIFSDNDMTIVGPPLKV